MFNINEVFTNSTKLMWDDLYRFAMSLTRHQEDAQDLLQTTLIKALTHFEPFLTKNFPEVYGKENLFLDSPEARLHLKNWLFKIMKNAWLDNRKNRAKWNCVELTNLNEPQEVSELQTVYYNEENIKEIEKETKLFLKSSTTDDLYKHILSLNPKSQSILFLYIHDYSYKEISETLDVPIGTVMSSLSRSISKIKSFLQNSKME